MSTVRYRFLIPLGLAIGYGLGEIITRINY